MSKKKYTFIAICLLISSILIIITNQLVLKDFPNSADEYSYLIAAKTLSQEKLSVQSPEQKQFFDFFHIINDGKFYTKYPIGWPLSLSLGILIKLPMLINLIFAILTLILIYNITKEISSEKTAKLSILLTIVNPCFILNSASYFAHPSALFFSISVVYFYLKNLNKKKNSYLILLGLSLGILLNIRPIDSAILSLALLIHNIVIKKDKKVIKNTLFVLSGFALPLLLFFFYNYLQTSNPFLMPFVKYNSLDTFGFSNGYTHSFAWALEHNLLERLIQLFIWIPLSTILLPLSFIKKENNSKKYLLLLILILFISTYFFYAKEPGNQYGPRYLYSSSFAIFILISIAINNLKYKRLISSLIIILNLLILLILSQIIHQEINQRTYLYDYIEKNNISNAVVFLDCFLCSGKMPAKDLTRNDIYFNNSVLYVNSYKEKNYLLMSNYPERNFYSWKCKDIKTKHYPFIDLWVSKNINCTLKPIKQ